MHFDQGALVAIVLSRSSFLLVFMGHCAILVLRDSIVLQNGALLRSGRDLHS